MRKYQSHLTATLEQIRTERTFSYLTRFLGFVFFFSLVGLGTLQTYELWDRFATNAVDTGDDSVIAQRSPSGVQQEVAWLVDLCFTALSAQVVP